MTSESASMVVKEVTCDAVAQGEYQCLEAPTTSLGSSVTPSVTRSTSRLVRIPTTIIMGSPERLTNNTLTTTITTTAPTARESEEVKKATSCVAGPILRSSARVQKRHRDSSPSTSRQPSKKLGTDLAKNETTSEQGKVRRAWELWSVEDKNAFFEALCECGKDFESIQNYIVQKSRKKGHQPQVLKNKDQVRHFYYRTWHKISKHLNISDDIKKQAQELYGLINYGELRKKIGGRLDEKNGQKLDELVHKGATTIRCKGKNLRIKTPVCRALKRLNDVEDLKDDENLKLPARICMELRPRSNRSWCHVQSLAQNPRIRLNVALQQRLSSILSYLQERWRTPASKQRDELQKSFPDLKEVRHEEPVLRLMPRSCDNINLISITASTEVSSASVSLQSYRRKVRSLGDFADASGQLCVKKGMRGKGKSSVVVGGDDSKKYVTEVKSPSSDSRNNNEQKLEGGVQDLDAERLTVESTKPDGEKCDVVKEKISVSECTTTVNIHEDSNSVPVHELTMRHLMALETAVANPVPKDGVAFLSRPVGLLNDCKTDTQPNHSGAELRDSDGILNDCDKRNESIVPVNNTNCLEVLKEPSLMTMDARERLEKLKQGWTLKDCGSISVGEVYLMLGNPSRLILEYAWESSDCKSETSLPDHVEPKSPVHELTAVLSRLLHTAALTFSDLNKAKQERVGPQISLNCRCSHQCCSTAGISKSVLSKNSSLLKCQPNVRGSSKSPKVPTFRLPQTVCDSTTSASVTPLVADSTNGPTSALHDCFRKPTSTQSLHGTNKTLVHSQTEKLVPCDKALREQLDVSCCNPGALHLLKYTQHRKAKGRMKKSVFVQRELPLLPKTGPVHSMMTLRIVPTASQLAGSFMPVLPNSTLSPNVGQLSQGMNLGQVVTLTPASLPSDGTSTPPALTTSNTILPSTNNPPCTLIFTTVPMTKPMVVSSTSSSSLPASSSLDNLEATAGSILATVKKDVSSSSNVDSVANYSMALTRQLGYEVSNPGSGHTEPGIAKSECAVSRSSLELGPLTTSSTPPKLMESTISDATALTSLSDSPPNISSILEISLPGTDGNYGVNMTSDVSADKLLDLTLCNSNSTFGGLISLTAANIMNKGTNDDETVSLAVAPLLGDNNLERRPSTPGTSPTSSLFRISSLGLESHWCNGEASEFSLSNLLGHLESPIKMSTTNSSIPPNENTTDCLINENCIDYISKFEDFAAKISTGESSKKTV